MQLAIFDIDGTLVRSSSERLFWRFLLRRRRQGVRQIAAYLLFMVRYLPIGGVHTAKKNKAYLSGLAARDIEQLAREFVAGELLDELYEPAVDRLRRHLACGDLVVLMSGTLHPIARALADCLGVTHVCATLANERDGRFTTQPPDTHPFDTGKLALAREFARMHGLDLSQASAYGDSRHDLPLLNAVGKPIAVCPDGALLAAAERLGWEILPDSTPVRFAKPQGSRFP